MFIPFLGVTEHDYADSTVYLYVISFHEVMATTTPGDCSEKLAKPLHTQRLQQALKLDIFLNHVAQVFSVILR